MTMPDTGLASPFLYTPVMPEGATLHQQIINAVNARREDLGWTWAEVARRAGYSVQYTSNLRNQQSDMKLATAAALLEAVGLTVILTGTPGFDPNATPKGLDGEQH